MTVVVRVSPDNPEPNLIQQAASVIRDGRLVAFPTETVYGLGADALNDRAVHDIFEAKGRPADNPLIVHVCNRQMLGVVASGLSKTAELLAERFWPGPLTLVLPRGSNVPASVSAGLDTVAVRMPRSRIALDLIRAAGRPIAAPSANISGRPSPTTAAHVLSDLDGRIDMVIDGGRTEIGVESTVLDVTQEPPVILRPGWITRGQLEAILGRVEASACNEKRRRSPGTRHRHYTPTAPVILTESVSPDSIRRLVSEKLGNGPTGFVGSAPMEIDRAGFHPVRLPPTAGDYARAIYAALRELDEIGVRVIVVQGISDEGEGAAVMDRLRRAASEIIVGDRQREGKPRLLGE